MVFSWFKSKKSLTLQTALYSEKDQNVSLIMKKNKHKKNLEDTVDIEPNISLIMKEKQYNKKLEYSRYNEPKYFSIKTQKQKQSNCGHITACLIILLCIFITSAMWTTNWYQLAIYKTLVFSNNSLNFNMWKNPSWQPVVSVYVFNYTNEEAVDEGSEKPNVQEIGPYVFREASKKVNVTFHSNGTVSYQVHRMYTFLRELSAGDLNATIKTPNIILFSGTAMMKKISTFKKDLLFFGIRFIPKFNKMSVNNLIMGYEDWFSNLGSNIKGLLGEAAPSKFGLLSKRIGLNKDVITMHTGKYNMDLYGVFDHLDGKSNLNKWNCDACDRIDGTDGTIYPPTLIARKQPLSVFSDGYCRTNTLLYNKETTTQGLPAVQYILDPNIFQYSNNSQNSCFCLDDQCPANGVQSIAPCIFDSPIFISNPHFTNSDEGVRDGVSGLNLQFKKQTNYVDIHKNLGVLIGGKTTFQMNVQAQNTDAIGIKDGTYLPIAWFELDLTSPPADMIRMIYIATYASKFTELFLKYGSIVISTVCLFYIIHKHKTQMREEKTIF